MPTKPKRYRIKSCACVVTFTKRYSKVKIELNQIEHEACFCVEGEIIKVASQTMPPIFTTGSLL